MTRHDASNTAMGGLLALALIPVFCWPSGAMAQDACTEEATDLIAGKSTNIGDVNVCNDDTTLTVTYELTSPWCLLATNLHVATSASDIPRNRVGIPQPDQFDDGDEYDPCVGTATFEILLEDIGDEGVSPGETVVIAAHAEVTNSDSFAEEGAWGDGTRFFERGPRATYFEYEVRAQSIATSCICDELVATEGATGAAVLSVLCQAGMLVGDASFNDTMLSTTVSSEASNYDYNVTISPAFNLCQISDGPGPFAISGGISNAEATACRTHLRVTCGQPVP